jgi:hypothetical protein
LNHLQGVVEVLAEVVTPVLAADEDARAEALDRLIEELVEPRLLHHASKRLQGLVLACLREAIRVYRLGGGSGGGGVASAPASPPPTPHSRSQHANTHSRARREHKPHDRGSEPWRDAGTELSELQAPTGGTSTTQVPMHTTELCMRAMSRHTWRDYVDASHSPDVQLAS